MTAVAHIHLLGEISSAGIFIFEPLTDEQVPFVVTAAGIDELENPADPGDSGWGPARPVAHIQTPEETRMAIQMLMDAGCTFPNFQDPETEVITGFESGGTGYDEWHDEDDSHCPDCGSRWTDDGWCPFCDLGDIDDE